jgi:putative ABC transport system ATP-binding protein
VAHASPTDAAVSVKSLDHWFGSGEARKQAIFDVNLEFPKGSLTVLMGPSGSGKTTVLTLMGTLRRVMSGSVRLLGTELSGASEAAMVRQRQQLGFIFQAHNLHESLTATQNVLMGLEVHGSQVPKKKAVEAAHQVLTLVGLQDRADYLPGNLSGGQKQRVAIARALVGNPAVVMADEPTAALDKESGRAAVSLLKKLARERGTTTIMVTHDNRVLDMADRIITLEDGRLVRDEKPSSTSAMG